MGLVLILYYTQFSDVYGFLENGQLVNSHEETPNPSVKTCKYPVCVGMEQ